MESSNNLRKRRVRFQTHFVPLLSALVSLSLYPLPPPSLFPPPPSTMPSLRELFLQAFVEDVNLHDISVAPRALLLFLLLSHLEENYERDHQNSQ